MAFLAAPPTALFSPVSGVSARSRWPGATRRRAAGAGVGVGAPAGAGGLARAAPSSPGLPGLGRSSPATTTPGAPTTPRASASGGLSGTVLVVGASRGLGRLVVDALAAGRAAGRVSSDDGGDSGGGGGGAVAADLVIHATTRVHDTTDGGEDAAGGAGIGRSATDDGAVPLAAVADGVTVVDVREREEVAALLAATRPTVVISCVGGTTLDERRPDYIGNQNIIDAAVDTGVQRFVLVSAMGAGNSEDAVPFQAMDYMRSFFLDKSRAEMYLKESGLPHTIVRPGPLEDGPATGTAVVTESPTGYGGIVRADLADLLVGAAASPLATGKTFTAVDRTKVLLTSPYVRPLEFWEELPFTPFSLSG
ncbi:hypothetical protein I4F81_012150 [Pyropia yezoensis]|uniref:Uncharacterized protein n=1 Tax=Pyropia yezoensis TaxID=2788 RepID=A0ACC3CHU8_PYRYE|nr:hypothetical protein I4F81_012150 [Neopyropia yezoensis]